VISSPEIPGSYASPESPDIPEHTAVLLLEGGQRFLAKAEEAMQDKDPVLRDYYLKRVLAILLELSKRLNQEQGGELVHNLIRLYDWWGRSVLVASEHDDVARLKDISAQMGEIRKAWEQVLFRGEGMSENPEF
jgi:flagellar protein FliS